MKRFIFSFIILLFVFQNIHSQLEDKIHYVDNNRLSLELISDIEIAFEDFLQTDAGGNDFQASIKMNIIVQNNLDKSFRFIEPVKFIREYSINHPWSISIIDQDNVKYCFPNLSIVDTFKTIKIKKGNRKKFNVLLDVSQLVKCEDSHPIDLSLLESLQITMYYTNYPTSNCYMTNSLLIKKD